MDELTQYIISAAMGILTILAGIAVQAVKSYLITKGGERAVKIVEIVAKNAVNAVEQVSAETGLTGEDKLAQAKSVILDELLKYNIHMTDSQLDTFVESAVKQMNDAWKA